MKKFTVRNKKACDSVIDAFVCALVPSVNAVVDAVTLVGNFHTLARLVSTSREICE